MSYKKKFKFISIFYKKYISLATISVLSLLVFYWLFTGLSLFRSKEATLLLAFENNGQGRMFKGEVVDDMTVFDVLNTSTEAGNIGLRYYVDEEGGVRIVSLDGYTYSDQKELAFYLNSKKIRTQDINKIFIKSGDRVKIDLE